VGSWDFLEGWRQHCHHRDSTPRPSSLYRVSIKFTLFRPTNSGLGRLVLMFLSHTTLDIHTRQDSSERVIRWLQGPLPTQHNKRKRQIFMPWAWIEPAIPAIKRPQTHALDCRTTGNFFTRDLLNSTGFLTVPSYSHYVGSSQLIRPIYTSSVLLSKSPTSYSFACIFNLAPSIIPAYSTEIHLNVTISTLTVFETATAEQCY